jgi:hypothetical protein
MISIPQSTLARLFPEYYSTFDSPVEWQGNTCTNSAYNGQIKVQLTLDPITTNGIEGAHPRIALWDGTQYTEQVEWTGEPYKWGSSMQSELAHVVGGCLNAIKQEMDNQSWQYLISTNPIGVQTVAQVLVYALGRAASLNYQDTASTLHWYQGRAKRTAPSFTISSDHMTAIIKHYGDTPKWR